MPTTDEKLQQFFKDYARHFDYAEGATTDAAAEKRASSFATSFFRASPKGVESAQNDAAFRKTIKKNIDGHRHAGVKRQEITSLDAAELNDHHAVARVHWKTTYADKTTEYDVLYLMQILDSTPKIIGYITE